MAVSLGTGGGFLQGGDRLVPGTIEFCAAMVVADDDEGAFSNKSTVHLECSVNDFGALLFTLDGTNPFTSNATSSSSSTLSWRSNEVCSWCRRLWACLL